MAKWVVEGIKGDKVNIGDIITGGHCSECGYKNWHFEYNFCPNCGADMRDEQTEPQTENPCDGCVCDDGKHLMYCMNCKGIAWKTEPPKIEDEPQTCEKCEHWNDTEDGCADRHGCKTACSWK